MENENEQLVVPPESEREKTEEGHTTSEENEIVSVENAETSETAAKISATDNAEDLPKKKGQRDMTEGVIWKQILAFALPILLSNVIQRLYKRGRLYRRRAVCRARSACGGRQQQQYNQRFRVAVFGNIRGRGRCRRAILRRKGR